MLCKYPVYVEAAGGIVPCGRCLHCRINIRNKKVTRLILENELHEHALFVTLTYNDLHLPTEFTHPETGEFYSALTGTLDPRALQLFIKRVRRRMPAGHVRFFACGEYGEKTHRPHYHLLIWGIPYERRQIIIDSWRNPDTGDHYSDINRIDIQRPMNSQHVIQYIAGYILKKMTKPDDKRLNGKFPEFSRGSLGIGKASVAKIAHALDKISGHAYINTHGDIPRSINIAGKTYPLDRYMRVKIGDALKITEKIQVKGKERYDKEMQSLRTRSLSNPEIPSHWQHDPKKVRWALEKQFISEKAQEMKNAEARAEFFTKEKTQC